MPGYKITTEGEEALAAATAETVLLLAGSTAGKARLTEVALGFDGVTSTAEPVQWKVKRGNSASQGTSSAATEEKEDPDDATAANTGFHSFSGEPTYTGQPLAHGEVHPMGGWMRVPVSLVVDDATNSFLGLELTAPAIVNVAAEMRWEVQP